MTYEERKENHVKSGIATISGVGIGALLMYFLDPARGRRRRAMIQDQVVKAGHKVSAAADTTARDVRNRSTGLLWTIRYWFTDRPVDDSVLLGRVRSRLGMLVRHPRSIEVSVTQGRVMLQGAILEDEVDQLLAALFRIRGVHQVENRLDVHQGPDGIPALQGAYERPPRHPTFELMQINWSPTARLLTTVAGSSLAILGLRRRGLGGTGMAAVGAGFLTRGLTNRELSRLFQRQKTHA